ncbi:hypothetical protein Bbelb_342630 [Branchiostoma belcheri]|nr:hypothetical protein Bbelb_342630 [Branchiostoma belcheri]
MAEEEEIHERKQYVFTTPLRGFTIVVCESHHQHMTAARIRQVASENTVAGRPAERRGTRRRRSPPACTNRGPLFPTRAARTARRARTKVNIEVTLSSTSAERTAPTRNPYRAKQFGERLI